MAARLTRSTAHRMIPQPDRWHLVLAWWRIMVRRAEQLRLDLTEGRR